MVYCPKCGTEVDEQMTFCPRCGAPLKAEAPVQVVRRDEKAEKSEKGEKGEKQEKESSEKGEKHEKREFAFVSWLIGGLILIAVGALAFFSIQYNFVNTALLWALLLLVIGVIIIVAALYFVMVARKRSPKPV